MFSRSFSHAAGKSSSHIYLKKKMVKLGLKVANFIYKNGKNAKNLQKKKVFFLKIGNSGQCHADQSKSCKGFFPFTSNHAIPITSVASIPRLRTKKKRWQVRGPRHACRSRRKQRIPDSPPEGGNMVEIDVYGRNVSETEA